MHIFIKTCDQYWGFNYVANKKSIWVCVSVKSGICMQFALSKSRIPQRTSCFRIEARVSSQNSKDIKPLVSNKWTIQWYRFIRFFFFFGIHSLLYTKMELPRWCNTGGKEYACQCRICKRWKFHPWVWEDSLEKETALQYSFLEYPMDRRG